LLPPEAVMVDGVDVAEVLMLVVPTLLVAAAVVVLAYTGVEVAAQELQYTTDEVVTGLTIVHGQLVMVKVVDAVTV